MITGNGQHKNKSSSWYLDCVCLWHLTLEQNIFVGHPVESATKIKCINRNHLLAKGIGKIRLFYLKKDGFVSLTTTNDILYILEAKANLLSLGQFSEQSVDMKTIGAKIYLH